MKVRLTRRVMFVLHGTSLFLLRSGDKTRPWILAGHPDVGTTANIHAHRTSLQGAAGAYSPVIQGRFVRKPLYRGE
jgi:hypothetical protein